MLYQTIDFSTIVKKMIVKTYFLGPFIWDVLSHLLHFHKEKFSYILAKAKFTQIVIHKSTFNITSLNELFIFCSFGFL